MGLKLEGMPGSDDIHPVPGSSGSSPFTRFCSFYRGCTEMSPGSYNGVAGVCPVNPWSLSRGYGTMLLGFPLKGLSRMLISLLLLIRA